MLVILCVAALAASALGSPSLPLHALLRGQGLRGGDDNSYAIQVIKSGVLPPGQVVGPAALIQDQYAVVAASLIGSTPAASLSVRVGTTFSWSLTGKKIQVAEVLVHPDQDVAVLKLQEAVPSKSASAIPLVGSEPAAPGSFGEVTSWSWLRRSAEEAVLVLPKYCVAGVDASPSGLCAKTGLAQGGLLVVDGAVVGLATGKGSGKRGDLVRFVDLAEDSVQSFILAATEQIVSTPIPPTAAPTEPPTTAPTEPPTTAPSEPPTTEPTTPPPTTSKPAPSGKTCKIHVNGGLPTAEPILLQADALAFRDPDETDAVVLAAGERLRFACPGSKNGFTLNKNKQLLTAECVEDDAFLVDGQRVELHQLGCKSAAANSAVQDGRCGSANQFERIRIGFAVGDDFITQIDNCFDSTTFDAVYSRMNMTPAVAGHESGVKRPSFKPAGFYENISPNTLFKRTNQVNAFTQLLGIDASTYVHPGSDDYFLARGHLSAKADYILGVQQSATFYYVNAAPQWQTFNGDNWEKLESSVRDWVVSSGRNVQVITGIWGTATLPNKDGVETELYLEADKKYLRVPKYYWKIVYDPATKEGAAFVGLNNPYHTTNDDDVFCKDECARYSWLSWAASNDKAGKGFCCDVNELKKVVTTVPSDVEVQALL